MNPQLKSFIILAVLGVAGYVAWQNRDQILAAARSNSAKKEDDAEKQPKAEQDGEPKVSTEHQQSLNRRWSVAQQKMNRDSWNATKAEGDQFVQYWFTKVEKYDSSFEVLAAEPPVEQGVMQFEAAGRQTNPIASEIQAKAADLTVQGGEGLPLRTGYRLVFQRQDGKWKLQEGYWRPLPDGEEQPLAAGSASSDFVEWLLDESLATEP